MTLQIKMVNQEFPDEMLDRFIFALEGRVSELFGAEKPILQHEAIEYLGIGKDSFYKLQREGHVKQFFFKGLSTPFYFRSQMCESLKKS